MDDRHADSPVPKSSRKRKGELLTDVLVPGSHVTGDETKVEVGNHQFTDDVIASMPADAWYRYGGDLVEISGAIGNRTLRRVTLEGIRIQVDSYCRLKRWERRGGKRVKTFIPCSKDNAGLIAEAASTDELIREIDLFTRHPVFTREWQLARPGFHNGVFFDLTADLRGFDPETDQEVIRQVIDDLLIDFPFPDEASRHNYVGILLTPLIRFALDENVPIHLINSPLERTGKTKLAEEVLGGIVLGRKTAALQMPSNNEEMNKVGLSLLAEGTTLIHLDNAPEYVDLPSLASLVTAKNYQGRQLGSSTMRTYPNNLSVVITGNNVRMSGELTKRTVPVLLQPPTDAPELRKNFVHPDIWAYVRTNRRQILSCLAGMVVNWVKAGRPKGDVAMGGFDRWAESVGGILQFHGFSEWMRNVKGWQQVADERRGDLAVLVKEWARLHGTGLATVSELLQIARQMELFQDVLTEGKGEKAMQISFGMRVLSRNVDVPVGEHFIRRSTLTRPALYRLEPIKPEAKLF